MSWKGRGVCAHEVLILVHNPKITSAWSLNPLHGDYVLLTSQLCSQVNKKGHFFLVLHSTCRSVSDLFEWVINKFLITLISKSVSEFQIYLSVCRAYLDDDHGFLHNVGDLSLDELH